MRRKQTPLLAMLFLGLCGGWIASCSDDEDRTCVPREQRLCAGVGRCQGVEECLPDGSGYGACDCSGQPRPEGNGGTSGDDFLVRVGRACAEDAQCGEGLTCYTSSSNEFLGGGPANGYCSLPCAVDDDCSAVDDESECVVPGEGETGYCLRTCLSLDPRSLAENKCLGRVDVVCQSEAYLGLAAPSGLRQAGWCFPQCGSDAECPGRVCDLARGVCVDTRTEGLPIGARCTSNQECSGRLCIGLGPEQAFCSAPCVYGQPIGCGYGLSDSSRGAGCLAPLVRGFLVQEGVGDVGFCVELCAEDSECEQAASGWTCEASEDIQQLFSRPGACDAPQPTDAGVDGDGGVTVDIDASAGGGDAG